MSLWAKHIEAGMLELAHSVCKWLFGAIYNWLWSEWDHLHLFTKLYDILRRNRNSSLCSHILDYADCFLFAKHHLLRRNWSFHTLETNLDTLSEAAISYQDFTHPSADAEQRMINPQEVIAMPSRVSPNFSRNVQSSYICHSQSAPSSSLSSHAPLHLQHDPRYAKSTVWLFDSSTSNRSSQFLWVFRECLVYESAPLFTILWYPHHYLVEYYRWA